MKPTRKSETARLQSIIMCGVERMEGVLIMAANTKALPRMDMSISGALRTPLMMIIVSGVELSSFSERWFADSLLCLSELFIANFQTSRYLTLSNCLFLHLKMTRKFFFSFLRKAQNKLKLKNSAGAQHHEINTG